jgi:predicted phosphodiesterase
MKKLFPLRNILCILALTLGCILMVSAGNGKQKTLRFGVCTDVHKDIMHDADERLAAFITEASGRQLDFIIQLGDFCRPYDYNRGFMSIWESYEGDRYHVIGNHEPDGGFTRQQVVEYLGMPGQYYAFEKKGIRFIVLDGNDVNPSPDKAPGYARFIGDEQKKWLVKELASNDQPVVVFIHQSLEGEGIENRKEIRELLEKENERAGYTKVIACFNGHHHTDYATLINGIYYIQINSMSYNWVGDNYQRERYSPEISKKYPWIKFTIPYKDPLYAFVEINKKAIVIEGRKSTFVGPGPEELGMPAPKPNNPIVPQISDRKLKRQK